MADADKQLREEYECIFELYDRNRSESLSHDDLKLILKDADITLKATEMASLLEGVDEKITCDKFISIMSNACISPHQEGQLMNSFQVFDKQKTGSCSADELKYVLENLGKGIDPSVIDGFIA